MTDHEEHPEIAPASATDPRSEAELDAIAEAEVEGLPVSTDGALRTTSHAAASSRGRSMPSCRGDASATNGTSSAAPGRT